jgi:hypothetical protein
MSMNAVEVIACLDRIVLIAPLAQSCTPYQEIVPLRTYSNSRYVLPSLRGCPGVPGSGQGARSSHLRSTPAWIRARHR